MIIKMLFKFWGDFWDKFKLSINSLAQESKLKFKEFSVNFIAKYLKVSIIVETLKVQVLKDKLTNSSQPIMVQVKSIHK